MTGLGRAFHGDETIKNALVARLRAHVLAGELGFGADTWDGRIGRPTGCTVHSADVKVYEAETGYPACLAVLLDFLHYQMQGINDDAKVASAHRFAVDWLEQVAPGTDLSGVPSSVVLSAMREERDAFTGLAESDPGLVEAMDQALVLHARVLTGDLPPRSEWTAVRAVAVSATDVASGKLQKYAGSAIEAICWNPHSSRSILVDMARPWAQLRYERALLASGWTDADKEAAETILQGLWADHAKQREAGEQIDYHALLTQRDETLAKRYADHFAIGNAAYPAAMRRVAEICLAALENAPITAEV